MERGANNYIEQQIDAFIRGFTNVLNRDVLHLFQVSSLKLNK